MKYLLGKISILLDHKEKMIDDTIREKIIYRIHI